MSKNNGITLISVVITLAIMSILAGLLIKSTIGSNFLKEVNNAEEDFYDLMDENDNKIKNIEEKWEGVI